MSVRTHGLTSYIVTYCNVDCICGAAPRHQKIRLLAVEELLITMLDRFPANPIAVGIFCPTIHSPCHGDFKPVSGCREDFANRPQMLGNGWSESWPEGRWQGTVGRSWCPYLCGGPDWRSRNMNSMVLAVLGKPSGVSDALSLSKPSGWLWGGSGFAAGSGQNLRMGSLGAMNGRSLSRHLAAQFDLLGHSGQSDRMAGDWPKNEPASREVVVLMSR